MSNDIVIISPHPDDEIIGCYSILKEYKDKTINVVYTTNIDNERRKDASKLREYFDVRQFFVNYDIPPVLKEKCNIFFFPEPFVDCHPDHRKAGLIGETMARDGYDVIFYTIQKNVPYIFELNNDDIKEKEKILNNIYESQRSLWEYEKKYIFFEGYTKFLFK
jgi:hypothetical protein